MGCRIDAIAAKRLSPNTLAELTEAKLTGKRKLPVPPPGLPEREYIRAVARQLGITEKWFRRRYLKEYQEKAAREPTGSKRVGC